eukprot:TRINITY_DN2350_c0_g1_i5.p1 TRINITY_DN2350_c0_g1~~TRINITY_DN2350_c0_g1_i5.p1  ORF type:complete len:190 (+),score=13.39 TRINITY_DN2350_c0_g1_i5:377-946(+)
MQHGQCRHRDSLPICFAEVQRHVGHDAVKDHLSAIKHLGICMNAGVQATVSKAICCMARTAPEVRLRRLVCITFGLMDRNYRARAHLEFIFFGCMMFQPRCAVPVLGGELFGERLPCMSRHSRPLQAISPESSRSGAGSQAPDLESAVDAFPPEEAFGAGPRVGPARSSLTCGPPAPRVERLCFIPFLM